MGSDRTKFRILMIGGILLILGGVSVFRLSSSFPMLAVLDASVLLLFAALLIGLYQSVTRPLSKLSESARKLDEMKNDFISIASHELRTPLTSIGGYVKLLAEGDAGPVTETQKEFLQIIDTNVVRLNHLLNDILDVESMDSHEFNLSREPQELGSILKHVHSTLSVMATGKKLELKCHLDGDSFPVLGDRARLIQLFMNLLSNAIKYTQQGSVTVEVEKRGGSVLVRVRDTGIGMTDRERESIFQRFYRTKSAVATGEGGTGLGLVIVRQILQAHGGTIQCESQPGRGTTFTVTLPLVERKSLPALDALEGLVGAQNRRAILAESNSDLRELIQRDVEHGAQDG